MEPFIEKKKKKTWSLIISHPEIRHFVEWSKGHNASIDKVQKYRLEQKRKQFMYAAESGTLDISFKNSITILRNGGFGHVLNLCISANFFVIPWKCWSISSMPRVISRIRIETQWKFSFGGKELRFFLLRHACMLESWLISTAEKQMLNHRRKEYYKSRGGACVFYRQHLTIKETTCKRTMCCNYWNRDDIIRSNAKTLLRKCLERFMYFFCFVLNNLEIYFQFDKNGNSCCAYRMEDR